ncbi:MAG: ROK family protein [Bacteroidales bacterium]|nr:ROK family protein [Bacteroidales bacterium]
MKFKEVLGIDIGGSGIKGAPVNTKNGKLLDERHRIQTPQPSSPENVAKTINELVKHFKWKGAIGCGFPAVVQNGLVYSAANVDKSWINTNAQKLFSKATGLPVWVLNDADAAGLAEAKLGAGAGFKGAMIVFVVGTGIGAALFTDGRLYPNLEVGHLDMRGQDQDWESYASDATRKREKLDMEAWGKRLYEYFSYIEFLFSPELIIIGGGASKKMDKFKEFLDLKAKVLPAHFLNEAGIIGAAMAARVNLKDG